MINTIEIEKKYIVSGISSLNKWLKDKAKLLFTIRQIDNYYTPAHKNYFSKKFPNEYLRIRKTDNKCSIAYKKLHVTALDNTYSYCDEFETEISSYEQMTKIFKALDFKYLITIDKLRNSYEYQNFEIAVDNVKELGIFCEIEIKGKFKSLKDANKDINTLAKILGLNNDKNGTKTLTGYVHMLAVKKGMLK